MRYRDIITEAPVPMTTYGYWIKPDGEIIPVPYQSHHQTIDRVSGGLLGTNLGIEDGWIRIAIHEEGELDIELRSSAVGVRARSALRRVMMADYYDRFILDDVGQTDKKFSEVRDVMAYLTSKAPLQEAIIPHSDYGYWISPEGKFHSVPEYKHDRIIVDVAGISLSSALRQGWIRVVNGDTMEVEFYSSALSVRARSSVVRLISTDEPTEIVLDDRSDNTDHVFNTAAGVNSYLMKRKKALTEAAIPATSYGYWIDPKGNFHPVDYQNHDQVIRALFPGERVGVSTALLLGWVRAVCINNDLDIDCCAGRLGVRARSAVRKLAAMQDWRRVYFSDADNDEDANYAISTAKQMLTYLEDHKMGQNAPPGASPRVDAEIKRLSGG